MRDRDDTGRSTPRGRGEGEAITGLGGVSAMCARAGGSANNGAEG